MLGKELNRTIRYLTVQNAKTATDVSTVVRHSHYHSASIQLPKNYIVYSRKVKYLIRCFI